MCAVQKKVDNKESVSPIPRYFNSMKSKSDNKNNPINEIKTASHVDGFGLAFRFKAGKKSDNIGVKNKSNPAIKAHFDADVNVIPHC